MKTLTLRLNSDQLAELEKLRDYFSESTYSKTIARVIQGYLGARAGSQDVYHMFLDSDRAHFELAQSISNLDSDLVRLLENLRQRDLFSETSR